MEVMDAKEGVLEETNGKTNQDNPALDEGQSVLNKEEAEKEDFLQPYLYLLPPSLIELLRLGEITRVLNTYLTHEVVLLEKHITELQTPKDKIFEKVINPYLMEVLKHPQSIKMSEGMLHIRDVEGPKKTGSMETRFDAMEQQVFKCQGMVERGLNANHMMITEFTSNHKMDAIDIGKHLSRLYDRVDQLQGQIYDMQN
ncbi:40S ribosomal protein S5-1 [Hordeum vulgare]|nr:40S ribosomal protein S5-1 [Hordeum vulgare]